MNTKQMIERKIEFLKEEILSWDEEILRLTNLERAKDVERANKIHIPELKKSLKECEIYLDEINTGKRNPSGARV